MHDMKLFIVSRDFHENDEWKYENMKIAPNIMYFVFPSLSFNRLTRKRVEIGFCESAHQQIAAKICMNGIVKTLADYFLVDSFLASFTLRIYSIFHSQTIEPVWRFMLHILSTIFHVPCAHPPLLLFIIWRNLNKMGIFI